MIWLYYVHFWLWDYNFHGKGASWPCWMKLVVGETRNLDREAPRLNPNDRGRC